MSPSVPANFRCLPTFTESRYSTFDPNACAASSMIGMLWRAASGAILNLHVELLLSGKSNFRFVPRLCKNAMPLYTWCWVMRWCSSHCIRWSTHMKRFIQGTGYLVNGMHKGDQQSTCSIGLLSRYIIVHHIRHYSLWTRLKTMDGLWIKGISPRNSRAYCTCNICCQH